jgi:hypothetical protein
VQWKRAFLDSADWHSFTRLTRTAFMHGFAFFSFFIVHLSSLPVIHPVYCCSSRRLDACAIVPSLTRKIVTTHFIIPSLFIAVTFLRPSLLSSFPFPSPTFRLLLPSHPLAVLPSPSARFPLFLKDYLLHVNFYELCCPLTNFHFPFATSRFSVNVVMPFPLPC